MPLSDADRFAELIDADRSTYPAAGHVPGARTDDRTEGEAGDLLVLVSELRQMDFDVALSEITRGRQRQRLVAMAAVRPMESPAVLETGRHRELHSTDGPVRDGFWADLLARVQRASSGRRVIVGLAGLSVLVAALGVLALLAQSSIPGDTLYALKRGTEEARVVLAGSEQAEGRVLLGLASTRLDELEQLLDEPVGLAATGSGVQAAAPESTADLLIATMETMDRQTTDGTSAMTTAAVEDEEVEILSFVGEWGIGQFQTLDELSARMPDGARARAGESMDLLQAVVQRLDGLAKTIECDCLEESSPIDALGPMPCPECDALPSIIPTPAAPGPLTTATPPGPAQPSTSTIPQPPPPVPPVEPPVVPTVDPPIPPVPPLEGSACVILGLPGIITGGVCIALPIDPPIDPEEGQPCILVDLPGSLNDILGIIVGGVCVIG